MQGARTSEDGDAVEGYHVLIGGGFGRHAALGREIYRDVKALMRHELIERLSQSLYGEPRIAGGKLHRIRAPQRNRDAQDAEPTLRPRDHDATLADAVAHP